MVIQALQEVVWDPATRHVTRTNFSGRAAERVAIARRAGAEPSLILLDEPTRHWTGTVARSGGGAFARPGRRGNNLSYLFISHDWQWSERSVMSLMVNPPWTYRKNRGRQKKKRPPGRGGGGGGKNLPRAT